MGVGKVSLWACYSPYRGMDPDDLITCGAMAKKRYTPRQTWGFLRLLLPRLAPYKGALAVAAVLLLLATGIGLAFPLVVRELLDSAFLATRTTPG